MVVITVKRNEFSSAARTC